MRALALDVVLGVLLRGHLVPAFKWKLNEHLLGLDVHVVSRVLIESHRP